MHKDCMHYLPHISVNVSIVLLVYVYVSKFKGNIPEHWNETVYEVNFSLVCLWPVPAIPFPDSWWSYLIRGINAVLDNVHCFFKKKKAT